MALHLAAINRTIKAMDNNKLLARYLANKATPVNYANYIDLDTFHEACDFQELVCALYRTELVARGLLPEQPFKSSLDSIMDLQVNDLFKADAEFLAEFTNIVKEAKEG